MSKAEDLAKKLRERHVGATGKRVLVVEGPDDVVAYETLLNRRTSAWGAAWVVAAAGNKKQALEVARLEPNWLALVDRDEWSLDQVTAYERTHTNLVVLPRFCLESYLVEPAELWAALPAKQQAKIPGGQADLAAALLLNMPTWRRHAALWRVINPLWSGLRALGFKEGLLQTDKVPDDVELARTLQQWSDFVDAARIAREVQDALAAIATEPEAEFLRHSVYAKDFYPAVVHPALNRLLGQKPTAERRQALFKTLPMPADLGTLWIRMGL